jgi:hypothetical protein
MPSKLTVRFNSRKIDELIMRHSEITIGRKSDNDLRLEDATVSNQHAKILRKDDGYYIEDCGSTNGTLLNGQPVKTHKLAPADVIVIGKYTITLEAVNRVPQPDDLDPTLQIGKKELEHILGRIRSASLTHSESSIAIDRKTLNWIAQDENGVWWGFENKPTPGIHGWIDALDGRKILLKQDKEGNSQWRDSLQKLT